MKKTISITLTIIYLAFFTILNTALGQITTTKFQPKPNNSINTPYDSTRNYMGNMPQNYIGQTLYLKGKPESLREFGYEGFVKEYTKYSSDKKNVYKCCQNYNSIYNEMAGKYFDVLDVIAHPQADKNKELYGNMKFLKLKEKESGDIVYYEYRIWPEPDWAVIEETYSLFPFIVVGLYEKIKKQYSGRELILSNRLLKYALDINTGKPLLKMNPKWKCIDITIEEKDYKPAVIAENPTGEKIIINIKDIDGKYAKGKTYSLTEAEEYRQKFGDDVFQKILQGKVNIGMTDEMCKLSWGAPREINETVTSGKVSEQWVYTDNYLYIENGIVTAIQAQKN